MMCVENKTEEIIIEARVSRAVSKSKVLIRAMRRVHG